MQLFVGSSYWLDTYENNTYPTLKENLDVEILVIGGGMTGMLSAFKLSESHEVVLIDSHRIGQASTCLNTGLIQYMSDDLMIEIEKKHGKKIAESFYLNSAKALDNIEKIVEKLENNSDFLRNDSLIIASDESDIEVLEKEQKAEKMIGLDTDLLEDLDLESKGLKGFAGLITKNDVELNPYKFVCSMGDYAVKNQKLEIFENTKASQINFDNKSVLTEDGVRIKYKKLIIATGYNFLPEIKSYIPDAKLIKTFALITSPMTKGTVNSDEMMVWETQSPYFYFRKSIDGNIIIGGNDKEDLSLDELELKEEVDDLRKRFLELRNIKLAKTQWEYSAIFGESESGLPYAGPHPDYPDVFIIHGVGGNGTVYSSIGSMYVTDFVENNLEQLENINYLFPTKLTRTSSVE